MRVLPTPLATQATAANIPCQPPFRTCDVITTRFVTSPATPTALYVWSLATHATTRRRHTLLPPHRCHPPPLPPPLTATTTTTCDSAGKVTTGALSVLAPYTWTLWIVILCTVVGIALVFWCVRLMTDG